MKWGAFVICLSTCGVALMLQATRIPLGVTGDENTWPFADEIPLFYAAFSVVIVLSDTILGILMYRQIARLRDVTQGGGMGSQTSAKRARTTRFHRRFVLGMVGVIVMSWLAIFLYVVAGKISQSTALSRVLGQAAYLVVGIHLSMGIMFMMSIRDLMLGYGFFVVNRETGPPVIATTSVVKREGSIATQDASSMKREGSFMNQNASSMKRDGSFMKSAA
ncbi:hypothetical protein HDU85_005606 [Gaertneriomyces sp. JEL0708]|nr:hypothetical protein HDU85_005606 [Gaertneriomyces sp. JEL0708]